MAVTVTNATSCASFLDKYVITHYSVAPTVAVLLILYCYEYYLKKEVQLIPPFMFLQNNDRHRTMVALGFGGLVSSVAEQLLSSPPTFIDGQFGAAFSAALYVMEIALINYPVFACIQSPYVLVASILGVIYGVWKLVFLFIRVFYLHCSPSDHNYATQALVNFFENLPSVLCYLALLCIFIRNVYHSLRSNVHIKHDLNLVVRKYQALYVKTILNLDPVENQPVHKNVFQRIYNRLHRPWFRYSTEFLLCVIMVAIFYYYFAVIAVFNADTVKSLIDTYVTKLNKTGAYYSLAKGIRDSTFNTYMVAFVVTAIVYCFQLAHLCFSHRNDVCSVYAGKKIDFMARINYHTVIRSNLFFAGYLVAYMVWGMLVFFFIFYIVFWALYLFIFAANEFGSLKTIVISALKYIAAAFFMPLIIYIFQLIMVYLVFAVKPIIKNSTAIKHMRLYHVSIYFFFFFNIFIGVVACLFRSIIAMFVSVLFLCRIDKTSMVSYRFKTFDFGYLAYMSFLRVQTAHKNPIMRCFCQLLLDLTEKEFDGPSYNHQYIVFKDSAPSNSRSKNVVALNRWYLALTLIRNPNLIPHRRRYHVATDQHDDDFHEDLMRIA